MRTVILKLFVISGLLFSQTTLIHAQAVHVNIVHLEADGNLPDVTPLPFDTVIVIDNRSEHGSAIGSELSKEGYTILYKFDTVASVVLQSYIKQRMTNAQGGGRIIVVNLKRFRLNENRIFFSADAYSNSGNNKYSKIASVDTVFKKEVKNIISGKAFDYFVNAVLGKEMSDIQHEADAVSIQDIQKDNVFYQWGKYPIINNPKIETGFYGSFDDFKQDRIYATDLELHFKTDSSFNLFSKYGQIVTRLAINPQRDSMYVLSFGDRHKKVLKDDNILPHQKIELICKDGKYFIGLFNIYLPLHKKNNTFCFQLPGDNPYNNGNKVIQEPAQNYDYGATDIRSFSDLVVRFFVVELADALHSLQTKNDKIKNAGNVKMEEGDLQPKSSYFIDMDTGELIRM